MTRTTSNPRKRPDPSGRLSSDAEIRRQKLRDIQSTGKTEGIHPGSLKRFWGKGYLQQDGKRITLTAKGEAVAAGRIGKAGRGAVDFSQANREAGKAGKMNSEKGHAARAAALRGSGTPKETPADRKSREAAEKQASEDYEKSNAEESKAIRRILPAYALKISPSDGSPITREHLDDLTAEGWTIAPAGTITAKVGKALAGAELGNYEADRENVFFNPDPLGPTGKAHAVIVWSGEPLNRETIQDFRHAGWDISPAPKRYREEPRPVKNPAKKKQKNPSPGEMIAGPHASAAVRKAMAKALAWYGRDDLVTEPQILKSYNAPEAVVEIGTCIALEYESHKFDGKDRIYRHECTVKRRMFISPDGSTIIVWPPFKVTKRGIEG